MSGIIAEVLERRKAEAGGDSLRGAFFRRTELHGAVATSGDVSRVLGRATKLHIVVQVAARGLPGGLGTPPQLEFSQGVERMQRGEKAVFLN
jgi:hypothetical protein